MEFLSKVKILAIDDIRDNLISLGAILIDNFPNSTLYTATNGEEGIESAILNNPDVILLDIIMSPMDGFDVCRILKIDERTSDIPIVFFTSIRDDKNSRIQALELGAEGFISKPIDPTELIAQIKAMYIIKESRIAKKTELTRLEELVEIRTMELTNEIKLRKKHEAELLQSYKNWKITFDSIEDALALIDTSYNVLNCNAAFEKLAKVEQKQLIENKCHTFIHKHINHMFSCPMKRAFESRRRESKEIIFDNKYYIISADPIINTQGNVIGGVHIITDISALKQKELELIKAKEKAEESDKLKSAFLANMSHEIRTPMNGILGFINLLQNSDLTLDKRNKFLSLVNTSCNRLLETINNIIEISRIDVKDLNVENSKINIVETIEFLTNFYKVEAEAKGLIFTNETNFKDRNVEIYSDKYKIESILSNLIKNAIKFTSIGSIQFGTLLNEDYILFYVKDTGQGIPQEKSDIIFSRFGQADIRLTRNYEGSGLGLAKAKAYSELLKANLWFESKVDVGSSFYFSLPIKKLTEKQIKPTNIEIESTEQIKKFNLLIVEDDDVSRLLNQHMLQDFYKSVMFAYNGLEGVEIAQKNPEIDLILMDLKMPVMNGIDATKEIRKFNKSVVIIAQTAYAQPEDKIIAIEAGCNDYVSKPVLYEVLIKILKKYFSINN